MTRRSVSLAISTHPPMNKVMLLQFIPESHSHTIMAHPRHLCPIHPPYWAFDETTGPAKYLNAEDVHAHKGCTLCYCPICGPMKPVNLCTQWDTSHCLSVKTTVPPATITLTNETIHRHFNHKIEPTDLVRDAFEITFSTRFTPEYPVEITAPNNKTTKILSHLTPPFKLTAACNDQYIVIHFYLTQADFVKFSGLHTGPHKLYQTLIITDVDPLQSIYKAWVILASHSHAEEEFEHSVDKLQVHGTPNCFKIKHQLGADDANIAPLLIEHSLVDAGIRELESHQIATVKDLFNLLSENAPYTVDRPGYIITPATIPMDVNVAPGEAPDDHTRLWDLSPKKVTAKYQLGTPIMFTAKETVKCLTELERSALVFLPTGAGKAVVITSFLSLQIKLNLEKQLFILLVVPAIIVQETLTRFKQLGINVMDYTVCATTRFRRLTRYMAKSNESLVVVTHFKVLNHEKPKLGKKGLFNVTWDYLVFDELHQLGNRRKKVHAKIPQLEYKNIIGMTATPPPWKTTSCFYDLLEDAFHIRRDMMHDGWEVDFVAGPVNPSLRMGELLRRKTNAYIIADICSQILTTFSFEEARAHHWRPLAEDDFGKVGTFYHTESQIMHIQLDVEFSHYEQYAYASIFDSLNLILLQRADTVKTSQRVKQMFDQALKFLIAVCGGSGIYYPRASREDILYILAESTDACSICLNDMKGGLVLQTPCKHSFCSMCIKEWLKVSRQCPLCRQPCTVQDLLMELKPHTLQTHCCVCDKPVDYTKDPRAGFSECYHHYHSDCFAKQFASCATPAAAATTPKFTSHGKCPTCAHELHFYELAKLEDIATKPVLPPKNAIKEAFTSKRKKLAAQAITQIDGLLNANLTELVFWSSKVEEVLSLVGDIHQRVPNQRIVIFSRYLDVRQRLQQILTGQRGIKTVVADSKKMDGLQQFTDPTNDVRVLIVSPKFASVGVTLSIANHMILMDYIFSTEEEYQIMSRCWRYGQRHPTVFVYRMVVKNTIEHLLYKNRTWKIGSKQWKEGGKVVVHHNLLQYFALHKQQLK